MLDLRDNPRLRVLPLWLGEMKALKTVYLPEVEETRFFFFFIILIIK